MRDALLGIALMLALIAGFSRWGPVTAENPGSGAVPGRPGESSLVVSGPGAEIVTVCRSPLAQEQEELKIPAQAKEDTGGAGSGNGAQAPEEVHTMDMSNLIWYAAGVMTVLIGEFAGVMVARAWQRLRIHREE